ncbi:18923_t:CDS:1, partial [Funneliformis geosporum]
LFIGFNEDETLQSLVVDSTKNKPEAKDEEILIKCKERLTAIATSDGIVRAEQSMLEQDEIEQ